MSNALSRLQRLVRSGYRVPVLRHAYMRLRLRPLVMTRGVRSLDDHGSVDINHEHNLKSLRSHNSRSEKLLLSSMCIEHLRDSRALIVGCRNEEEVFMFRGYGFRDVTAVDLLSYSPLVEVGDMHKLAFPDDTFDYVFCAYTLVYSRHPRLAAQELARVCTSGGHVAIAIEYMPWERRVEIQTALVGYTIVPDEKLDSVDDILRLFEPYVGEVEVRYDAELKRHHESTGLISDPSPIIAVFSISK